MFEGDIRFLPDASTLGFPIPSRKFSFISEFIISFIALIVAAGFIITKIPFKRANILMVGWDDILVAVISFIPSP